MAKICVTGVAGFLGSHLAERFTYDGHEVFGVDNLLGGTLDNIPKGVQCHVDDCRDLTAMKDLLKGVDVVYHCAAAPHEGLSVFSPCIISEHTYNSTVTIAAAAAYCGVKRVVFTSSMARYGSQKAPFVETMGCFPRDPYGVAKAAAESTLRLLAEAHGFEYVIAVPHNIIGIRQKYDDPFRNVASIMINRMLQGKQPIIYGDGGQVRSFSYIADCVAPLAKMAFDPSLSGEVINIGPDEERTTINELAQLIATKLGWSKLEPVYVPARPMEVRTAWVSVNKARELLNYKTETTLSQALDYMIDWVRSVGTKPFVYHLPIEIDTPNVPVTWRERMF